MHCRDDTHGPWAVMDRHQPKCSSESGPSRGKDLCSLVAFLFQLFCLYCPWCLFRWLNACMFISPSLSLLGCVCVCVLCIQACMCAVFRVSLYVHCFLLP